MKMKKDLEERLKELYVLFKENNALIMWKGQEITTEKDFINKIGSVTGYRKIKDLIKQWDNDELIQLRIENRKAADRIEELEIKSCRRANEIWDLKEDYEELQEENESLKEENEKAILLINLLLKEDKELTDVQMIEMLIKDLKKGGK